MANTPEQTTSYFPVFFSSYSTKLLTHSQCSQCMGHGFITAGEAFPSQAGWERVWKGYVVGRGWCLVPGRGSLVQPPHVNGELPSSAAALLCPTQAGSASSGSQHRFSVQQGKRQSPTSFYRWSNTTALLCTGAASFPWENQTKRKKSLFEQITPKDWA